MSGTYSTIKYGYYRTKRLVYNRRIIIMGEIRESAKTVMIRDMNLQQIKCVIDETLNSITIIGHNVAVDENDYEQMKHNYEIKLLQLKYSDEYMEYKTVKEKEERARIELAEAKEAIISFDRQISLYKKELEHKRLVLKYLFRLYDEKVKRE